MKNPRSIATFFILAYLLSWCAFVPLALQAQGLLKGLPEWLHLLGAYGPCLVAFISALSFEGMDGVRRLTSQITRWRIGWRWWLVAVGSPLLIFGIAVVLARFFGNPVNLASFGQVAELPALGGLAGWAVWILTFGFGEESGWRGFALPRLQARYTARTATLILGLLWAACHAPTFFTITNFRCSPCLPSRSASFLVRSCSLGCITAPLAVCWQQLSGMAHSTLQ